MKQKPSLTFWQIWNLSFGFLGIQIGYSLQSSQTSRILSALGADPHHLPLFWLAAPIAGSIPSWKRAAAPCAAPFGACVT